MARVIRSFWAELPDGSFRVGAHNPATDYQGPVADVEVTKEWVTICTDPYEGCAMLNVEALPDLIKVLRKLQKKRAAA